MTTIESITKFFYFSLNYAVDFFKWNDIWGNEHEDFLPTFIMGANWGCNKDHIISLWKDAENETDYYGHMNCFFGKLDDGNRKALIDWMMENYNG